MEPNLLHFAQNNLLYVVLAAASGAMLLWQTVMGAGGAGGVTPLQATLLMNREDALVIDVREANEWAAGHIPNSRHIPLSQLSKRIGEIEKFKTRDVIVNCQSGNRSASGCGALRKLGFEKVHNLAGGISAWREAGLPITSK
ncbi:inner membrane protein YgaP [mine drainage metagenome]|uniref:Inner membrane protein YgaP n=1 Tax=mine drainage metagenome TaxID=410659 RepID=A0A1J5S0P0_9ZZZZ